ncbi:MAG: class I SAM-dependent methyltransferase [Synechococcales cyanobacterium M58_A2018_015]|nr:class I SAM-dependent methyltransferase [Synechococcales cyanobacterium M58_A2018_015]
MRCFSVLSLLSLSGLFGIGLSLGTGVLPVAASTADLPAPLVQSNVYQYRKIHHPDGIGKIYMGREIAQVMGHQGAAWLERPSRVVEERPDVVIAALGLQPTDVVADIGAGTGYFSFRLSAQVPQGKVFAVDVQPEMLEILQFLQQETGADNVEPVLGSETDPHLPPASLDLALMVDAYHEFAYPREMMAEIVQALKPGGRVVLVEYRGENPLIPIKRLHKMTQGQVRKEMQAVGLVWQSTQSMLPQQHILIFQKPFQRPVS